MPPKGENPKHKQKKTSKAQSTAKVCNETSKVRSTPSPPMECTAEEYSNLLSIASSLSPDEAKSEFVECARYGDLDAVRALIEIWSSSSSSSVSKISNFVNTAVDSNGTTALHKAGSNGHVSTVQLLLHHGARHVMNASKNTPLHWAARNGHEGVVEMILKHDFRWHERHDDGNTLAFDIDVLQKNEFGRSILTEGFASENTKLVGLLLEHDSASEDKLLDGGAGNNDNSNEKNAVKCDEDGSTQDSKEMKQSIVKNNESKTAGIIHEFDFLRDDRDNNEVKDELGTDKTNNGDSNGRSVSIAHVEEGEETNNKTLLIRELPITNADTPFGETAIDDTTGLGIWSASLVMSRWMASKSILGRFDNKTVLELGAGCGVPGLTVALYSHAKSVYVTDLNPVTVDNIQYNIEINANRQTLANKASNNSCSRVDWLDRVSAASIDWDNEETWPQEKMDFIIGSDLIYQRSIVPLLHKVLKGLLKPDGRILYTCPSDGRDGLVEFIDTMKKRGFRCISEEVAPDFYKSNPLSSGDEEDAFLHFYELPVTEYKLYEFQKS